MPLPSFMSINIIEISSSFQMLLTVKVHLPHSEVFAFSLVFDLKIIGFRIHLGSIWQRHAESTCEVNACTLSHCYLIKVFKRCDILLLFVSHLSLHQTLLTVRLGLCWCDGCFGCLGRNAAHLLNNYSLAGEDK